VFQELQEHLLNSMMRPPSMVNRSRGKVHPYALLREASRKVNHTRAWTP